MTLTKRINIHILSLEKLFSLEFTIEDSLIKFFVEFDINSNLTQLRMHCANTLLSIYPKLGNNFGVGSFMDSNGCDIDHTVPIIDNYEDNLNLFTYLLDKNEKSEFKISQYVHLKQSVAGAEPSKHIRILKLLAARSKKRPITKIDDDSSAILPIVEQDSLDFTSNSIDMPNILSKSCLPFTGDLETSILMDLDIDNDHRPNKYPRIDNLNDTQNNFNNDITLDMIDLPDISIVLKETPAKNQQVISVPSSEIDEAEKENQATNTKPVTENKAQKVKEVQKSKPEVSQSNGAKTVNSKNVAASKLEKPQDIASKKPAVEIESESESDSGSESDSAIILSSAHSDQELTPKENKNQQNTSTQKGKSIERPVENKAKEEQQKPSDTVPEKVNAQKDKAASKPLSDDSDSSDDSSDESDDEGALSLAELTSDHLSIPKKDTLNTAKSTKPQSNETNTKQPAKASPVKTVVDKASIKDDKKSAKDEESESESESEELSSGSDSASSTEEAPLAQSPKASKSVIQKTPQPTKTDIDTPQSASRYNLRSREKVQTPTKPVTVEKEPESESSSGSEETDSESESESESGAKSEAAVSKDQTPVKKTDTVVKSQDQDIKQKPLESKESNPVTVPKQAQKAPESESSSGSEETETESETESESESDAKPDTNQIKSTASKPIPADSTKKPSDKSVAEVKSKDEESSSEEETDSEEETESESESEDATVQTKSVKVVPSAQPAKVNDSQINKPSAGATPQVNKAEESSSESESDSGSESESETDSSSDEDESPLKSIAEPKLNGNSTQSTPNQVPKPDTANRDLTIKQQLANQASKRTFFPKVEAPQVTLTQMAQLRNSQIRSRSKDSKLLTVGSLVDLKRLRTDDEESSSEEEASESESDSSDSDDSSSDEDEKVVMPTPKVPKLVKSNKKQKGGKSDLFSLFKDL
ncbi:hypothetical protein CONCODRAFT_14632 [Conidiobolus coronatus NRRL 28638]|uniref:Uncharacterized protein n=1 Tax=Conidiobolus coronatus (strain ATCC 28846 / CBS 209.66 / NRRL 28638) TaxID=796925 RepID=A0A137PI39_CONC2|nr:hypothetical protein CONCODRAFT_14632 [Conidiobolus coronatus NRRL 28638]|eukprot:KXN74667.1 hypothetical protein CONCODRAFT_14632 [Conidiobolus coronatus NRRL 28638]